VFALAMGSANRGEGALLSLTGKAALEALPLRQMRSKPKEKYNGPTTSGDIKRGRRDWTVGGRLGSLCWRGWLKATRTSSQCQGLRIARDRVSSGSTAKTHCVLYCSWRCFGGCHVPIPRLTISRELRQTPHCRPGAASSPAAQILLASAFSSLISVPETLPFRRGPEGRQLV
jgi:hypothetical protein